MKKIIFALMGILFITSCSSDEEFGNDLPQIYINKLNYTLGKSKVLIQLTAEKAPTEDLSIPISFVGKAEENKDFEVEKKAFLLKAGEKNAFLEIKRIGELSDDSKTMQISLGQAPQGYKIGLKSYCMLNLLGKDGFLLNFMKPKGELKYVSSFGIAIDAMKKGRYRVMEKTFFGIEVDASSTAVLGEHFELLDAARAIVPRKRNRGSFRVKFLKLEEGKDKIVLRFAEKDGFAAGTNETMTIMVKGPTDYAGSWKLKEISNAKWLEDPNNYFGVKVDELINVQAGDEITLEGDAFKYKLKPNLNGKLKNIFIGECDLVIDSEREDHLQETTGEKISLSRYKTEGINVLFSPSKVKKRPAFVDFRLIKDEEGKDILECTLADFEPTTKDTPTWKNLYEMMGEMTWTPIRLHFERK